MRAGRRGAWAIAAAVTALAACRTSGAPRGPEAPGAAGDAAMAAGLCAGRAACRVRRRRAVAAGALVELALPVRADGETCAGAEYWWVPARGEPRRLARDCDQQTGADALGHADTRLDGDALELSYQGFLSSDGCEGVRARLGLSPLHAARVTRYEGLSAGHQCRRSDELTADWDASDFPARWSKVRCQGAGEADPAGEGTAIPRLTGGVVPDGTAVGTCGARVDASRAARWMREPAAGGVVLRAAVVGQELWLDVEGAAAASTVTLITALSPQLGDGLTGQLGCAGDEERRLSTAALRLDGGDAGTSGDAAAAMKVVGRTGETWHLRARLPAATGRLAITYRAPDGARLDTARLGSAPTAAQLPPLAGPFPLGGSCAVVAGRLDVRPDNMGGDPALALQPSKR